MKQRHSKEFKESIVQKIMTIGGPTIMQMSVKTGIGHGSIRNWIKQCANPSNMKNLKERSPEEKLEIIMKTFSMSENEFGEYLRASGLHSTDVEQWKQDFYSAQRPAGRPRLDPELLELRAKEKELERDLKRKDKALAEMAARIILIKKSHLLFGVSEED